MINEKNIIVIAGSTASGKTGFAIRYSHFLKNNFGIDSEIINADSLQLYEELKIITAHPSKEELSQAKHNLYGILSPNESSSVAFWLRLVQEKIEELQKKKKIAILCGGTGFYISAILRGISNIPEIPEEFRQEVLKKFQSLGRDAFFYELSVLDPILAATLHKNNTQRLLRGYEVSLYTKKPLSEWWKEENNSCSYSSSVIVLLPRRDQLNERCLIRINKMMNNGAIEEVENFIDKFSGYRGTLCSAIGYKEILSLINNEISKSECIERIHIKTKQYAKRQSTWFRNQLQSCNIIEDFGDKITDFILTY